GAFIHTRKPSPTIARRASDRSRRFQPPDPAPPRHRPEGGRNEHSPLPSGRCAVGRLSARRCDHPQARHRACFGEWQEGPSASFLIWLGKWVLDSKSPNPWLLKFRQTSAPAGMPPPSAKHVSSTAV